MEWQKYRKTLNKISAIQTLFLCKIRGGGGVNAPTHGPFPISTTDCVVVYIPSGGF